jgi:hypothetical protein
MLDQNSRSATVRGYVESINTLFRLQDLPIPDDLSDHNNMCTKIILVRDKEEEIARRQNPITREIFAALLELGAKSATDSLEAVVADWFTFIRITGLRCAEYTQKCKLQSTSTSTLQANVLSKHSCQLIGSSTTKRAMSCMFTH